MFSIRHNIRRIRKNIQKKVGNPIVCRRFLAKYGSREKRGWRIG